VAFHPAEELNGAVLVLGWRGSGERGVQRSRGAASCASRLRS